MLSILKKLLNKSSHEEKKSQKKLPTYLDEKDSPFFLGEKEIFLLHYLRGRNIDWGIDESVVELFDDCYAVIDQLFKNGYLEEDKHTYFLKEMNVSELKNIANNHNISAVGKKADLIQRIIDSTSEEERISICPDLFYVLTPLGLSINAEYVKNKKEKNQKTKDTVYRKVSSGDYIGASLARAEANSKEVISPGIGVNWSDTQRIVEKAEKSLDEIREIDFSDLNNTPQYIELLISILYLSIEDGADLWETTKNSIASTNEKIQCNLLDIFFTQHDFIPEEYIKVSVYLDAKRYNLYQERMKPFIKEEDYHPLHPGEYRVADSTFDYWKEVDEYRQLSAKDIPGFPKTFKTFQKHKKINSEKYQKWIESAKA